MRAAEIVTEQRDPSKALHELLELLMKQSGADEVKLCCFSSTDNRWSITASVTGPTFRTRPQLPDPQALLCNPTTPTQIDVPAMLLDVMVRTRSCISVTNSEVLNSREWRKDPYFTAYESNPAAFLALPVLVQSKLEAVLFFTSSWIEKAFESPNIPFLQLTGAQLVPLMRAVNGSHSVVSPASELESSSIPIADPERELDRLREQVIELEVQMNEFRRSDRHQLDRAPMGERSIPATPPSSPAAPVAARANRACSHSWLQDDEFLAPPTPVRRSLSSELEKH